MVLPEKLIDFHTHLWGAPDGLSPRQGNPQILHELLDRFPLERLVILPLFGGTDPTPAQVRAGNLEASRLAKKDARMHHFVRIHPVHGRLAIEELERGVEEGACGVKLWVSPADDPQFFPVVEKAIMLRIPLLIHAMHKTVGQLPLESDPVQVAALARRFPEATIVMAHIGGNFLYGCEAIRECPNVLTDCSGTFCEQGMVEHAVAELGVRRVLFGSDTPGADFVNNLAKVAAAELPPEARRRILFDNARALLP